MPLGAYVLIRNFQIVATIYFTPTFALPICFKIETHINAEPYTQVFFENKQKMTVILCEKNGSFLRYFGKTPVDDAVSPFWFEF